MRNPVHGSPLTWPQRNYRGKERDIGLTWHLTLTQLSPGKENSSTMGPWPGLPLSQCSGSTGLEILGYQANF